MSFFVAGKFPLTIGVCHTNGLFGPLKTEWLGTYGDVLETAQHFAACRFANRGNTRVGEFTVGNQTVTLAYLHSVSEDLDKLKESYGYAYKWIIRYPETLIPEHTYGATDLSHAGRLQGLFSTVPKSFLAGGSSAVLHVAAMDVIDSGVTLMNNHWENSEWFILKRGDISDVEDIRVFAARSFLPEDTVSMALGEIQYLNEPKGGIEVPLGETPADGSYVEYRGHEGGRVICKYRKRTEWIGEHSHALYLAAQFIRHVLPDVANVYYTIDGTIRAKVAIKKGDEITIDRTFRGRCSPVDVGKKPPPPAIGSADISASSSDDTHDLPSAERQKRGSESDIETTAGEDAKKRLRVSFDDVILETEEEQKARWDREVDEYYKAQMKDDETFKSDESEKSSADDEAQYALKVVKLFGVIPENQLPLVLRHTQTDPELRTIRQTHEYLKKYCEQHGLIPRYTECGY